MRLPTVHDGRAPLLQRPENQVRSVRGHVQVPCTGLAGAPHTSKGQGARGQWPLRWLVSSRCSQAHDDDTVLVHQH